MKQGKELEQIIKAIVKFHAYPLLDGPTEIDRDELNVLLFCIIYDRLSKTKYIAPFLLHNTRYQNKPAESIQYTGW